MALSWVAYTCIAILLASVYVRKRLSNHTSQLERDAQAEKPGRPRHNDGLTASARQLRSRLLATIPHITITPENVNEFEKSTSAYWDQKAREVQPSCVVRPRNVWELAQAVKILRQEEGLEPVFAVAGGGHSPVGGASSMQGGVLVDLSLFDKVILSEGKKSVGIGAGCRWIDVYAVLEKDGLAVVGGRNSAVGVARLTLGGGLSFFSPQYGFVCSNVVEYEVVLADGSIVTADQHNNTDLWRALKGGGNNFGIVTRFTVRTFPCMNVWSGFVYYSSWKHPEILSAFHSFVARTTSGEANHSFDPYAAGPLACFTYLQSYGIQGIAVNLVHTSPDPKNKGWPSTWLNSGFKSTLRFWSTCKVRTLREATDEVNALNPPQRRQEFATTTIKNDLDTLTATHTVYRNAIQKIRQHNVKGMAWTLVLQPLLPTWTCKGDANPMGLDDKDEEALVIVSFTVNWALSKDDDVVQDIIRAAIGQIDAYARKRGTQHKYRYMNYCAKWQKPFEGYGEEDLESLHRVRREVDPEGLFQHGCSGGFKLGM
ncbi:hypothetical protein COCC4DRAFT_133347 [Bipolaris maydis ATCC 48331]|uniref:FAD-binding PCMH-type domain-containing protein n=2 Tax=Cochliobolus heterostrophus TaxID=5016 RepID=M2T741_COCH5|nr:uncharacterized protein COCC4DRAFT_133347 [Bipolaris maydis ATCC 48331]EMD93385.1 hypothetical protein COCHEDRAFT_1171021 [Bipolaris maydis C5]KAJ5027708.1 hypothetical protein J3E73DRAFT_229195 [Bipolaris maydis]ENI07167.1 hypothetical protein COCC4DRAFT_133347 [Bipolaris maydis ATCC 48331]KAJ6204637.1 FAD binding domain-containing protein [Bipolaris maydis]KAJ6266650.1 hypothetical protein PSV08DRAFT_230636 [Bipolaris maydis]